jgi:2-phospho-L-lactate/phosphoenolpyruvate guanylyltransferase
MKAILVPIKEFRHSKKRLAAHFPADARAELAEALCEDFFATIAALRGGTRIFVVSAEPRALALARAREWETIVETAQLSESQSVDAASRHCAALGITHLLRLPIDIPLVEPADIEAILTEIEPAPSTILVPSRDGTGTNALLRSPPDLFPSHFGPDSFAEHLKEAKRSGARVKIIENPRLALDIDEYKDFVGLNGLVNENSATARWMNKHYSFNGTDPSPPGG